MNSYRAWRIFYNFISPIYDIFFGSKTPRVKEMRKRIVQRLELKEGDSVLEIAVGTGANLPHIKKMIGPMGKIHGLDISEGMLKKCRELMQTERIDADIALGNAEKLPYKDKSFDAILNFGAMNFYHKKKKVINEMIRVAKPGAKIVIGDEIFPFLKLHHELMKSMPENVIEPKLSYEKVILTFWVIEFRKKG